MYNTCEELEVYDPEDVLNPIFLFLNNDFPKYYYQYFKRLNKPHKIYNLAGIKIESKNELLLERLSKQFKSNELSILQLDFNKPLKMKDNIFLFTLFNISEEMIVDFLYDILETNKKEKLIIGLFIGHPLTSVNEFITNIDNQLVTAREHNCVLAVLNLFDY